MSLEDMQECIEKEVIFKIDSDEALDRLDDAAENTINIPKIILTMDVDEKLWDFGHEI